MSTNHHVASSKLHKTKSMKRFYLLIVLYVPILGLSQNVDQNVIGTAGEYYENSYGSLSWTMGEIVTETHSNSQNILTQGFQQSKLTVTNIAEEINLGYLLIAYPNPVENYLTIECNESNIDYRIIDINGKTQIRGTLRNAQEFLDFSNLPTGSYFLQTKNTQTHKIIKH